MTIEPGFPKLHLPPWFHDGWEQMVEMKEWFAAAYIEIEDGVFVKPEFISTYRFRQELEQLGFDGHHRFWSYPELIVVKTVSLTEIRSLLPDLVTAGVFAYMPRYDEINWEEY